jgi:hypothetical protein
MDRQARTVVLTERYGMQIFHAHFAIQARRLLTIFAVLLILAPLSAHGANTPCSGRKGGVDRCQGETFICRDGSVSASKKSCSATMGGVGLLSSPPQEMTPALSADCSCLSERFCVGPRGGHYCLSDRGKKSYLKK